MRELAEKRRQRYLGLSKRKQRLHGIRKLRSNARSEAKAAG